MTYLGGLTNGKVQIAIVRFLDNAIGLTSANPFMGMFSFLIGAALIYGTSYLLLRKAPVKI